MHLDFQNSSWKFVAKIIGFKFVKIPRLNGFSRAGYN